MEIIHLILGKANPDRMNGVNKVVHEFATNQVQRGYKVQVWGITAKPVHDYPERIFKTELFRHFKNPFMVDKNLKTALVEKKGQIVVHLHGAFIPVFYSVSQFLYQQQIPFIITPHSTYNKVMMKKNAVVKNVYFRLFESKLLNRASTVHLLGKTEWEGLEAIYHNKKSILIPYGFKKPTIDHAQYEKAPVFTVGYCGRLAIYPKGLDILLEGFSLFHQRSPRTELMIIGDGKEKEKLEKMANDLHADSSIHFMGSAFGEDKIKLLMKCHVFAHPSRTDGLPATIVEAASLGLPCVVSEATNTDIYIEEFDAGYAMHELSAEAFCKGLQKIYERIIILEEEALLRKNSLSMIETVFDWTRILNQFNTIYANALAGPNSITNNILVQVKKEQVA